MLHHVTTIIIILIITTLIQPTTPNPDPLPSDPITRFQTYLRINTSHPNPNYTTPITFLTTLAQTLNLQTQTHHFTLSKSKPILLLTWPGSDPTLPSILLNSHLDSVPAEPSKWSHPPFSATLTTSGRIYARGAQDDKSISIQYLESIRNLKQANFVPVRTVHVAYVPDEEIGGEEGAKRFYKSREFEEMNVGFAVDEGQASEGEMFRVFYADRVPWHVRVKARGGTGHGSRLFDGSGFENLMECVERIYLFRESQFELVKRGLKGNAEVVSVNSVFLKAGIPTGEGYAMNMQPSEAEAGFDIRIPPTVDSELILKRLVEEWAPASRNMTYEIVKKGPNKDQWGRPLMTATDDTNPWWSVFEKAVTAAGGKLAKPEILASTTDARFLRERGIPTLGFSPMSNTPILLHDNDEFLQDTVFLRGITVYESIIRSLSSFEGAHSAS